MGWPCLPPRAQWVSAHCHSALLCVCAQLQSSGGVTGTVTVTGRAAQAGQDRQVGSPEQQELQQWRTGSSSVPLPGNPEHNPICASCKQLTFFFFFLCEWRAAGWKYCFMLLINCCVCPLLGLSSAMNSALSKTAPYWEVSAPFYPSNSKAGVLPYTLKFNFPSAWYLGSSLSLF